MRSRVMSILLTISILVLVLPPCGAVDPPASVYRVGVTGADLSTLQRELEDQQLDPLIQSTDRSSQQIQLGEFEYYVDAYICRERLIENSIMAAEIIEVANVAAATAFAGVDGPLPGIFHQPEHHISEMPNLILPEEDSLVVSLKTLQESPDTIAYRQALADAIEVLAATDVRKGFALTRNGIQDLLGRRFDKSLQSLRQVANGEVTATRVDRIKAMRRVAWILHQQGDRLGAYQAYREMGAFTGSDLMRCTAAVECAGLLMELARSDKGELSECRRECLKALEISDEADPDYRQLRATAELMFMETFYYEDRFDIAAGLADDFMAKYRDRPRELSMALLFQGASYKELGNPERAKAALLQLMNTEFPDDPFESWGALGQRWDMRAKGARLLKEMAEEIGDAEGIALADDYLNR